MEKSFHKLEFDKIIEKLKEYSYTEYSKEIFNNMQPYLSEAELISKLNETTEARKVIDRVGTPPLISIKDLQKFLIIVDKEGILNAGELEYIAKTIRSIKRLKDFLNRCKDQQVGIAYYADEIEDLDEIRETIERCIRDGRIDDYASNTLKEIRRNISIMQDRIESKAEKILEANKNICSDNCIIYRNNHTCLPVKREYKTKILGSIIDESRSGETLFIEPSAIIKLNDEIMQMRIDENNEEVRILYTISSMLLDVLPIFNKNISIIEKLDFAFAKGKLSLELNAIKPDINNNRYIKLKQARHPLLNKEICVPLDFIIENETKGIIITGPNTGGKTVCIKTIGLLSLMAQCGLHIPCEEAIICMNNQILCDIGDGQDITQNLSTFSAHITNILDILDKTTDETMVIIDELGSGTDPTEGMGIAIAVLEELKNRNCIFIVTTHYPEVKAYVEKTEGILNARMEFDRQSLRPLYRLEMGKVGESCAIYIAKKLGMPQHIIERAYKECYGDKELENLLTINIEDSIKNIEIPKLKKKVEYKEKHSKAKLFNIGDSVTVYPEKKIGIVCKKADDKGNILVQMSKGKTLINYKRLKLKVSADKLYPEDYDFSIIFDTVENRKKRHKMSKGHNPDIQIEMEN